MSRGILAVLPLRLLRDSIGARIGNREIKQFNNIDNVMFFNDRGSTDPRLNATEIAATYTSWAASVPCDERIVSVNAASLRLSSTLPNFQFKYMGYTMGDCVHAAIERLAQGDAPHAFDDAWGLLTANDKVTGFCCDGAARARHVLHCDIQAVQREMDSDAILAPDQVHNFISRVDHAACVLSIKGDGHAPLLEICAQIKDVLSRPDATARAITPLLNSFMVEVGGWSHE